MSKKNCEELKTQNAKIVKFYKEHPSIDFEKANLLLIYLLDTVFNHISNDLDSNINSQILSYLTSTKKDFDNLKIIYHLVKERGFTLEGAKKKLKENKEGKTDNLSIIRHLKEIRGFLVDLKEEL